MTAAQWARLTREGPSPLRRGAWYRVTKVTGTEIVLAVNQKSVVVPRGLLELVAKPPGHWTVVARPAKTTRLPESWGDHYAVCPSCRTRAVVAGTPEAMRCPRCNGLFPVAWDERYLGRP
jgi:hypothetical protein